MRLRRAAKRKLKIKAKKSGGGAERGGFVGGSGLEASEEKCAVMAARELYDYLANGNIKNSVNLPDVSLSRMGVCRLCVIHHNVPKMINRILDRLGADVNVEHMINKPRDGYAYTMVDLGSPIDQATADSIRSMEHVLRVRVI